jgi:hypothetical protein
MNPSDRCRRALFAGLALAGVLAAQKKPQPPPPTAEQAIAKAQKHHRRALLTFLAETNARSEALQTALLGKDLAHLLQYEFETGQVMPLEKKSTDADLAAKYGIQLDAAAMPALVVVAADGKQLATFAPKDLFDDGDEVLVAPLTKSLKELACAPLDGDKVLAAALAEAKQADKRLLLTFDAPW